MDFKMFMLLTFLVLLLGKLFADALSRRRERKMRFLSEDAMSELRRIAEWTPDDGPDVIHRVLDLLEVFQSDKKMSYSDMALLIVILTMEGKPWAEPRLAYEILRDLSGDGDETNGDPYWVYLYGVLTRYETAGFPHDPVLGDYLMKVSESKMEEELK